MKALKILVIAMGALIVGGFALVAITIATRVSDPAPEGKSATPGQSPAEGEPWQAELPLPDGCRLGQAQLDAGRLLLRLDGPSSLGCGDLLLVDPQNGRILGRISPQTQEP